MKCVYWNRHKGSHMDNDNSRNNEGISYYSFIIVFPILPYIIEYYYVVQFMYYINPNKRVLLYYPIPCMSIQIIIKFCAFVTSILRKKRNLPSSCWFHWSFACSELYANYCSHSYHISHSSSSFFFDLGLISVILHTFAFTKLSSKFFPKIMQKVSLGIFFCSLSCCWRCQKLISMPCKGCQVFKYFSFFISPC